MNDVFVVSGYLLDEEQREVVKSKNKNILVIAGAGSGKSLTIIGKIKYLIENGLNESDILCISFTNDSCSSLKNNLLKNNIDVEVLTFHKLGMKILRECKINVNICQTDTIDIVVDKFFYETVYFNEMYIYYILKYFKIKFSKNNYISKYKLLLNNKKLINLKTLIIKFIHLFKANGFNYNYLEHLVIKSNNLFDRKNMYLFIIIIRVLYEYKCELDIEGVIDFDDIILLSTKYVNECPSINYKYIIIDEFQDTSFVRYNLVKNILDKTNASFLAVGDDYQSIYRFTGCDLFLFLNFDKYFDESMIYKIQTTYRNSQELINVAGNFIKKNKLQIKKDLKSCKSLFKPIKIIYYKNQCDKFYNLINYLYKNNKKRILVLVRNNNDIMRIISEKVKIVSNNIIVDGLDDVSIIYLTVHRSKGLEEEVVILLSLDNSEWGFPNKIKDEKILRYVLPQKESYLYSEERRLFYVALTRSKNEIYLFVDKENPSLFVCEIMRTDMKYIDILDC